MSVAKTVELTSQSDESFQDAIEKGVAKAADTIKGMRQAWVNGQKVFIDDGKVVGYQVDLKVTFVID